MIRLVLRSIAAISLAACGTDSTLQAEPISISLTTTVPAGSEIYRCRYLTLPPGERDIVRFEHEYTEGSHHILLYPTDLTPTEASRFDADFDCNSVGDLGQVGLAYGADEQPTGSMEYPEGVGLRLGSEQVVLLESHYLNSSDSDLEATVTVRMIPSEQPVEVLAGNLFYYNYAILIPPEPGEATSTMGCDLPEEINLLFASSHMHRRGTLHQSELVLRDGTRNMLHQTSDWASPMANVFSPALKVPAGSRIEFGCNYRNDLPHVVTEGESADTDEMCMFIASYWPKQSPEVEACVGGTSGPMVSGSNTCIETLQCAEAATTYVEFQECIVEGCAGSSAAVHEFLICLEETGCDSDECIETNCASQALACAAANC